MPKVVFGFNLPEEQDEYDIMNQAPKVQRFLWEFSQQLRSWQKYGHQFEDADDALNKIREEFYTLIKNHEVNIDL